MAKTESFAAEGTARRVDLILTVQTPLGFFVLAVLVIEDVFGPLVGLDIAPTPTIQSVF